MEREGRLESKGACSIDVAAAQQKLAKFTLPDSRGYILKLPCPLSLGAHPEPNRHCQS